MLVSLATLALAAGTLVLFGCNVFVTRLFLAPAPRGERGVGLLVPLAALAVAAALVTLGGLLGSFRTGRPLADLLPSPAPLAGAITVTVSFGVALAAVLAFALVNKVLSAQYMIWPYALAPLVTTRRRLVWAVYFVALGLTQYLYPHGWNNLTGLEPLAIAVQAGRNVLLLLWWVVLLWEPRQTARRVVEAGAASGPGSVAGDGATPAGSGSSGWARRAR